MKLEHVFTRLRQSATLLPYSIHQKNVRLLTKPTETRAPYGVSKVTCHQLDGPIFQHEATLRNWRAGRFSKKSEATSEISR